MQFVRFPPPACVKQTMLMQHTHQKACDISFHFFSWIPGFYHNFVNLESPSRLDRAWKLFFPAKLTSDWCRHGTSGANVQHVASPALGNTGCWLVTPMRMRLYWPIKLLYSFWFWLWEGGGRVNNKPQSTEPSMKAIFSSKADFWLVQTWHLRRQRPACGTSGSRKYWLLIGDTNESEIILTNQIALFVFHFAWEAGGRRKRATSCATTALAKLSCSG